MTTLSPGFSSESVGTHLYRTIRTASPVLWWTIASMFALSIFCLVLQQVDGRLINGVSVWAKPAKFFASLAMQYATVAWALQFLPAPGRNSRSIRLATLAMVAAGWLEIAYIVFRASRGEASHFNVATPTAALLYNLMAIGAVTITASSAYVGWRIWRQRSGVWSEAAATGLLLGALLGTLAGFYLGGQPGHTVGGDPTDAAGTGLFGWSTTGGDLRVAHFVGLHAAQIIPFAAISGRRSVVWLSVAACTALTIATFAMAIAGVPLFRA